MQSHFMDVYPPALQNYLILSFPVPVAKTLLNKYQLGAPTFLLISQRSITFLLPTLFGMVWFLRAGEKTFAMVFEQGACFAVFNLCFFHVLMFRLTLVPLFLS